MHCHILTLTVTPCNWQMRKLRFGERYTCCQTGKEGGNKCLMSTYYVLVTVYNLPNFIFTTHRCCYSHLADEETEVVWATITNYHRLGGLNNRNVFLIVLEAGKSKIKAQVDSMSGDSLLPGSWTAIFLLCPQVREGERVFSGVSFIRALISFMRVLPSWL